MIFHLFSRWHRHSCRAGSEGYLYGHFQDQCQHRSSACLAEAETKKYVEAGPPTASGLMILKLLKSGREYCRAQLSELIREFGSDGGTNLQHTLGAHRCRTLAAVNNGPGFSPGPFLLASMCERRAPSTFFS